MAASTVNSSGTPKQNGPNVFVRLKFVSVGITGEAWDEPVVTCEHERTAAAGRVHGIVPAKVEKREAALLALSR
jgi:hypothetical protein